MTDLPGDPNWLLATVVQSAAIIVAVLILFHLSRRESVARQRSALLLRHRQVELSLVARRGGRTPAADGQPSPDSNWAEGIEPLEIELRTLNEALDQLKGTRGSVAGLLIIGCLTAVGIFFPLILMPARNSAFDPAAVWALGGLQLSGLAWKRLVIGAFAAGVLAALAQLAWTSLRRIPPSPDTE